MDGKNTLGEKRKEGDFQDGKTKGTRNATSLGEGGGFNPEKTHLKKWGIIVLVRKSMEEQHTLAGLKKLMNASLQDALT